MEVLLKPRRCILKRSVCVLLWTLFLSLFVLKRNVFVLSKLLNIYCKFVKSVSIHLHQIPAAVKKYAVYPLLKYTNKTFFTLLIKNQKSSFRYQFPHKYIYPILTWCTRRKMKMTLMFCHALFLLNILQIVWYGRSTI